MTHNRPGERWYRRLLHLYPKDFREEFGGEMTRFNPDRGREERWWSSGAMTLLVRPLVSQPMSSPPFATRCANSISRWPSNRCGRCRTGSRRRGANPPHDQVGAILPVSALLLVAVGIYGVLRYGHIADQIDWRADGARRDPASVLGLVVREGMSWAGSGIVLGLIGAFAAARVMATVLFDVPARHRSCLPRSAARTLVALVAFTIPALRAVRSSDGSDVYPINSSSSGGGGGSLPSQATRTRERRLAGYTSPTPP